MKKILNSTLNKLGYSLSKLDKDPFNIQQYKTIYSNESIDNKCFHNVGAGSFYHPFWTNVDYMSDWYSANDELTSKGIHYDLFSLEPIPVNDNSSEIVYTSHTIEHIKNEHAQNLFNQAHRILKNNGVFRITCPDIDLHYSAYSNNDFDFFYWRNWYKDKAACDRIKINAPLSTSSIEQLFLQRFAAAASTLHSDGAETRISDNELRSLFKNKDYETALDYCSNLCTVEKQKQYPGNHTNWWNREKVMRMLKKAGFKTIYISGYGQSRSTVLRNTSLFDSTHPKISLYIEAVK